MKYQFNLPLGARFEIAGKTFIYQGDGAVVGDEWVPIIECTLSDSQMCQWHDSFLPVSHYKNSAFENEIANREVCIMQIVGN